MITFFSVAKPFRGHIDIIQRNAIESWLSVWPDAEIVIFGDEYGTPEVCCELGILHGGPIRRSEFGRPLVSDAFARIRQIGRHDVFAFINCDIILLDDFLETLTTLLRANMSQYLMSSRRYQYHGSDRLQLSEVAVRRTLRHQVLTRGTLEGPAALDCFVFPRSVTFDMPSFAVGEVAWDNWMIQAARDNGVPVVDATPDCVLIHQRHVPLSAGPSSPDGCRNIRLAGGLARLGTLREADWVLQGGGLIRPSMGRRFYTVLQGVPPVRSLLHLKRATHRAVGRIFL
jgi:hypothetical protein